MATCLFRSPLASRLQSFLETRRATGRWGDRHQKIVLYLDRFLTTELQPGQAITRRILMRWIEGMAHLSTGTRINRLSILRQFCLYLRYFDSRTCIIQRSFLPRRTRSAPHIYTREEVHKIMAEANRLDPPGSLRPVVIATIIGVLYATGIRIGEALNLTLGDVDLQHRVIQVRKSKFKKSRYVPIAPSTAHRLATYLRQRQKAGSPTASTAPFFVTLKGTRYGHPLFTTTFLEILRKSGIRGPKGNRGPRIHDFRHTFAVDRLLAWYRQGDNLHAKLPLLSTYLGHATVTGTEVYLHATAQLLESTGKRFHNHFAVPPLRRKAHGKD